MPRIADHAKTAHGMTEIPKDTLAKDQAAIKEA
jgi:predicted small metal-binding protein